MSRILRLLLNVQCRLDVILFCGYNSVHVYTKYICFTYVKLEQYGVFKWMFVDLTFRSNINKHAKGKTSKETEA